MTDFQPLQQSWRVAVRSKRTNPDAPPCALPTGGYGSGRNELSSIEEGDPTTGVWKKVGDLPTRRGDVACDTVNGLLYVAGGYFDPTGAFCRHALFLRRVAGAAVTHPGLELAAQAREPERAQAVTACERGSRICSCSAEAQL